MSKHVRTITTCNGCFRTNFHDRVQFVKSEKFDRRQLDLCFECDEGGRFICVPCATVHNHEKDCLLPAVERLASKNFGELPK